MKGNSIMKKPILIILLLIVFSGEAIAAESVRPCQKYSEFDEFVRNVVKKKIAIERSYKIETDESFILAPNHAVRLDFKENPAGAAEFIFFYNDEYERVDIIYRCTDDTEEEYNSTSLRPEKLRDYRGICATGAAKYLNIFCECKFKDGKAFVKFRTTLSLSEKDRGENSPSRLLRRIMLSDRGRARIRMSLSRATGRTKPWL